MNKNRNLLFSIVLMISTSLATIGVFCGEEFMKYFEPIKVILSALCVIGIFILLYLIFCIFPNWKVSCIKTQICFDKTFIIYDDTEYERKIEDSEAEKILFLNKLQKFARGAFWGYSKLKFIELPSELNEIPSYTFVGCESLEKITIPDSVETIGKCAFYDCIKLSEISISENSKLTEIKDGAFTNCNSLKTVVLPISVKKIDKNAFSPCVQINYRGTKEDWARIKKGKSLNTNKITYDYIPDDSTNEK